jgi:hypothetical protein
MGLTVDASMRGVPVLSTNSNGSFETYFDFGRALAVLTTSEGRYTLRKDACAWDLLYAYCVDPAGGPAALAAHHPWGGYAEFADGALLQAAYDRAGACVAGWPGGCAAIPASFPAFSATRWLP